MRSLLAPYYDVAAGRLFRGGKTFEGMQLHDQAIISDRTACDEAVEDSAAQLVKIWAFRREGHP
jgi:hypothetical protein